MGHVKGNTKYSKRFLKTSKPEKNVIEIFQGKSIVVSVDISCGIKEWLNEMSDLRRASVGVDGVFFFSFFW